MQFTSSGRTAHVARELRPDWRTTMKATRIVSLLAASALSLSTGCYATYATSRTYGEREFPGAGERRGKVETVRETIDRRVGDPAGGAVAGALVGGLLTGRAGGAVLGAFFGAAASQGSAERRYYEVYVHFEDGGRQVYTFAGSPPFQSGDRVVVTDRGIFRE
jgi:outer membrane lipoprotein SlyB